MFPAQKQKTYLQSKSVVTALNVLIDALWDTHKFWLHSQLRSPSDLLFFQFKESHHQEKETSSSIKPHLQKHTECWTRSELCHRWRESLHMLAKPQVWQRRSLSYWQSFPQSLIQSLFMGCVQRRVKEFKIDFIPPITRTSPISPVNNCTWRDNKKSLLVTIHWGRNVSTVPVEGGPAVWKSVKFSNGCNLLQSAGDNLLNC